MSLKAVHLLFVACFSALAFGCGAWKLKDYLGPDRAAGDLPFAVGAFLLGLLVIWYGKAFLKKLKNVSYL